MSWIQMVRLKYIDVSNIVNGFGNWKIFTIVAQFHYFVSKSNLVFLLLNLLSIYCWLLVSINTKSCMSLQIKTYSEVLWGGRRKYHKLSEFCYVFSLWHLSWKLEEFKCIEFQNPLPNKLWICNVDKRCC